MGRFPRRYIPFIIIIVFIALYLAGRAFFPGALQDAVSYDSPGDALDVTEEWIETPANGNQ